MSIDTDQADTERPVSAGVVRSTVGVAFDLEAFWGRIAPPRA